MANDLRLNGTPVPLASKYVEKNNVHARKNTSLSGRDSYDFMYRKRSWVISWKLLPDEQFTVVKLWWDNQYSSGVLPLLSIPSDGITDVPVYIDISDLTRIYNNQFKEGFSVTLTERDPS